MAWNNCQNWIYSNEMLSNFLCIFIILNLYLSLKQCLGLALVYLGIQTFQLNDDNIKKLININFQTCALIVLNLGIAAIILSIIGFNWVYFETKSLFKLYQNLLVILLFTTITGLSYGPQNEVEDAVKTGIENGMNQTISHCLALNFIF